MSIEREEQCRYCGGDCPDDHNHACDGFIGDIDNLYGSYDEEGEATAAFEEDQEVMTLKDLALYTLKLKWGFK